jgi:serine/threonine protein kinase
MLFDSYFGESSQVAYVDKALENVHKNYVFHRDLKSENVLLDQNFRAKLCDFGSSVENKGAAETQWQRRPQTGTNHRDIFGTQAYNAPEVSSGSDSRAFDKCDVFSLGCLLFLLVWSP